MKRIKDVLVYSYIIASVFGFITATSHQTVSRLMLAWGADGWVIALAYCNSDMLLPAGIGCILFVWLIASPVAMVVCYLLARREIYTPFLVFTVLDASISVFHYLKCLIDQATYQIEAAVPCVAISMIYVTLFVVCVCVSEFRGRQMPEEQHIQTYAT